MKHLNCCQKVLLNLHDLTGMSEIEAENFGSAFGSGACSGEICGAVSGALMSLGNIYNNSDNNVGSIAREYQKKFIENNEYLRCSDLLGFDMSDPEDCVRCAQSGIKSSVCPKLIKNSEEIVRELYSKYSL